MFFLSVLKFLKISWKINIYALFFSRQIIENAVNTAQGGNFIQISKLSQKIKSPYQKYFVTPCFLPQLDANLDEGEPYNCITQ